MARYKSVDDLPKHLREQVIEQLNPSSIRTTAKISDVFLVRGDDNGQPAPKTNRQKYGARATEVDGVRYASKAEARRYQQLIAMEKVGVIRNLKTQPKFVLQEAFTDGWGEKHRAITYTADFSYMRVADEDVWVVEDVKGGKATQTQQFRIKWKLAIKQNPTVKFELVEG